MRRLLIPDPGQIKKVGIPRSIGTDPIELDWKVWPGAAGAIPEGAFNDGLLTVNVFAKLRPCLVLTHSEEIDAYRSAHLLPISTVKGNEIERQLLRMNRIPHRQFLVGEPRASIEDGEVDFRWSWRVNEVELRAGVHEAELDSETLAMLVERFCDYLETSPD